MASFYFMKNKEKKGMQNTQDVKAKIVRKARIARQLLAEGNRIIDIKQDHADPDGKRSVFVFLSDEKFENDFNRIMEENEKNKSVSKPDMDEMIEREVQRRVDAAIEERFKKIEKFAEV